MAPNARISSSTMATTAPSRPSACGTAAVHRTSSRPIAKPAIAISRPARRTVTKSNKDQRITASPNHRTNIDNDGGNTCSSCGQYKRLSSSPLSGSDDGAPAAAAAAAMPATSAAARITPIIKVVHVYAPMLIRTDPSNFRALVQQLTGKNSVDLDPPLHHHGHDDNGCNEAIIIDPVATSDNCISSSHDVHQPTGQIADHRCRGHYNNPSSPKEERKYASTGINSTSYQMEDADDDQSSNSWINHSVKELYWTDQDNLPRLNTIWFTSPEGDQSTDFSDDQSSEDLDMILAREELITSCNSSAISNSTVSCSADYDCDIATPSTNRLHNQTVYGDPLPPLFERSAADNYEDQELTLNIDGRDMHYISFFSGEPTYNVYHSSSKSRY